MLEFATRYVLSVVGFLKCKTVYVLGFARSYVLTTADFSIQKLYFYGTVCALGLIKSYVLTTAEYQV